MYLRELEDGRVNGLRAVPLERVRDESKDALSKGHSPGPKVLRSLGAFQRRPAAPLLALRRPGRGALEGQQLVHRLLDLERIWMWTLSQV